jgi:hypothetical protein
MIRDFDAGFHDRTRILSADQFSRRDVIELTGLTDSQLKNTLDRDLVQLTSRHNPGSGRRRMFTGGDILKIVVAHTMSAIGFPMKWSYLIANDVERRASNSLIGAAKLDGLKVASYPQEDGDWARVEIRPGDPDPAPLPIAYQILEVDRIINETLAKLRALIAEQPVPSFKVPDIKAADPFSPENDFFKRWDADAQGRRVLVGLSFEETIEYHDGGSDSKDRFLELHDKHEQARFARLNAEAER